MLAYVPAFHSAYAPLAESHRWLMENLVANGDREGWVEISIRRLAALARRGKSTVQRQLAQMVAADCFAAVERPIDRRRSTRYRLAEPFRIKWEKAVSQARDTARPTARDTTQTRGNFQPREGWGRAQQHRRSDAGNDLPAEVDWGPRLRAWAKTRFWQDFWGPKPNRPDCYAPQAALEAAGLR